MYDDEDDRPVPLHARPPIVDVTADAVLDDTRPCPFCCETIKIGAIVCRFCRTDLRPQIAPAAAAIVPPSIGRASPPEVHQAPRVSNYNIAGWLILGLGVLSALAFLIPWSSRDKSVVQDPGRGQNAPIQPARKTMEQRVEEAKTIEGALATASFDDSADTIDPGAAAFARWAFQRMRWPDVDGIRETNFATTMKDSRAARGKRSCFDGTVVEIAADHTAPETVWIGGLSLDGEALRIVRFVAVRDSSGVVAGTETSICGVVTGRYDYTGSASNVVHAIFVVGMLDTPANRAMR